MKKVLSILAAAVVLASCCCENGKPLPRAERSDINVALFDSMFYSMNARPTDELHSVMVIKDDAVIYEKYAVGHGPEELHICWSASKTFTAIGVGFAEQDGLLSTDDHVIDFFSEDELPAEKSEWLKEMTIHDLLIMSSGFDHEILGEANGWKVTKPSVEQLAIPVTFEPGSRFHYNSMNTYLCSVIVTKVTGMKLVDYLKVKFFDPLGIPTSAYVWDESPEGVSFGGWGLHCTAECIGKAGLFMLHRGVWNGERLLQDSWFDKAMAAQIYQNGVGPDFNNDWGAGYGYQMWQCKKEGCFRFDGAWGQFSVVMPEKNAVVVLFEHANRTHLTLNDMWKYIYPEL